MLKLLRPGTGENVRDSTVEETENGTRNFYTSTKTVRINSTQNNDPDTSRNMVTGVGFEPTHTFVYQNLSPAHLQNKETKSIERRHNFSTQNQKRKNYYSMSFALHLTRTAETNEFPH